MSGSKSKFPGSSMNVGNTPGAQSTKGGAKSSVSASKKGGGAATTAAPLASGIAGNMKSGPVQVFLNGKIVTPQSLIPRKSGHSHHGKKLRTNITKPQTIDENSSDNAEKPIHGFPSKINLKRNEGIEPRSSNNVTAGVSKLNVLGKNKPVVEESVSVILTETHTQMLLAIPSFIVASDTRDVIHTDERNARYDACVKAHKNVDSFSARTTQTKNNQLKNQNEMAAPNAFREFGSQAISYEIKDEIAQATATNTENDIAAGLAVGTDTADDISGLNSHVRKFVSDTVGVALVTPGCLLDTTNAIKPPVPGEHAQTMPKKVEKNKNKSMVSRSMANTSEVQSEDEGNFGFSVGNANKGGKGKKDDVSSASSGNNSNPDNVPPSGSRANISQSNAGDSAVDSEDGLGGGGSRTYGGNATFTEEDSQQILRENEIKNILNSPMLLKRLHMIERAIQQNANYRNQLDYRDLPDIPLLQLLSADRAKHVENADQLFGASTLGGKSSMGMKRTFTDRSKSLSHGMLNHEGSFNDAASTVSSEGDRGSLGGDGPGSVRLKAENLFHLDASNKTKKLFCYSNPDLIQGRSVTSMAWNALSTDLLAVGYGRSLDLKKFQQPPSSGQPPSSSGAAQPAAHTTSTGNLSHNKGMAETKESTANHNNNTVNQGNVPMNMIPNNNNDIPSDEAQEGLVLFWSLRNPDYPEKILRTPHSVTAVEFSKQNPMILAVGLSNGDVNIYDVKREGASWGVPIESSAGMEGSHMDPVWQLKWIVKGAERLETLVSISTDGRILEWNLKKGLVMSKLMQLKKSGAGEGWISNSSAGLCFDFSPADASTYVTGTEDGNLFRCSVSYNEQYLETYQNHEGPVYRVRFSNRWANVFLSCSADWSMNLYHLSLKDSLLSIRATAENFPINDICWCPDNATVFACVTVDAKLQIWDLSVSSIDPVVILDIGSEDLQNDNNNNANNESSELPRSPSDLHSLPNSPALGASRYGDRYDPNNANSNTSANVTPVARLLKNLAVEPKKRILTTVLFGENNPVLAVGDNRGNVSVYRVFEPITITNLGPLQQFLKLKEAVIRQTDPVNVNTLEADHGGYVTNNNLSGNNLLAGLSPAMLNVNPSASFSVPLGSASLHSIDTMN